MPFDAGIEPEREESQLVKDLKAGKAVIERYGWTRHTIGTEQIGFCAQGALIKAIGLMDSSPYIHTQEMHHQYAVANAALANVGPVPHLPTPLQNDEYMRSKEQVLQWFDRAIDRAGGRLQVRYEPARAAPPLKPLQYDFSVMEFKAAPKKWFDFV